MTTVPLSDNEMDALSATDRAFLLDAWEALDPSQEAQVRALAMLVRGVVKHDTATVHTAVAGVFELQDAADRSSRELLEAARQFREDTAQLTATVATATEELAQLREQLAAFVDSSTADRADLRRRIDTGFWWLIVVSASLIALFAEALFRYWPLLVNALLSFAIVVGGLR